MPARAKKVVERPAAQESLSPTAYNHVVESASISDIKLIHSNFYVNPSFFDRREDIVLSIDKECTDCTDVENGSIVAFFSFELKAIIKGSEDSPEVVMNASAVYLAAYDVAEDSQQREAAAFCGRVGLFATYPYFRALVAHLAGDADLDIPALPLISSPPHKKAEEEEEEEEEEERKEGRRPKGKSGANKRSSTARGKGKRSAAQNVAKGVTE
jgi:hypothetical protein